MTLWKSIRFAPRDGTIVLGICPGDDWPQPMSWYARDPQPGASEQDGYWRYAEDRLHEEAGEAYPSHWLDLPDPPGRERIRFAPAVSLRRLLARPGRARMVEFG